MGASAKPFAFLDFEAPATPAAVEPRRPGVCDVSLEEARAEGVLEGRRLAMETIAADEAASLARIADAIEKARSALADARERDQAEMLTVASQFLEAFATGLAEKRELEAALDLLRRLTAHSDDRRPVRLVIAQMTCERLAPRIETVLQARRLDDFVSIESDSSLKPGEMRLEWRGGQARRTRREITEAAAALTASLRATREQER
jgi:thioredoxin-like negative regulator of GroEL